MKSNQEIFNITVEHLRKQGVPAFDTKLGECQYRTSDGLKCAVGCHIPDEHYFIGLEGQSISGPNSNLSQLLYCLGFNKQNKELLFLLQQVHDYKPVQEWEAGFDLIANKFNLEKQCLN